MSANPVFLFSSSFVPVMDAIKMESPGGYLPSECTTWQVRSAFSLLHQFYCFFFRSFVWVNFAKCPMQNTRTQIKIPPTDTLLVLFRFLFFLCCRRRSDVQLIPYVGLLYRSNACLRWWPDQTPSSLRNWPSCTSHPPSDRLSLLRWNARK